MSPDGSREMLRQRELLSLDKLIRADGKFSPSKKDIEDLVVVRGTFMDGVCLCLARSQCVKQNLL